MKINWPYLHFFFDIGIVRIETVLMAKSDYKGAYEYIVLNIRVWKWRWEFSLYKPGYSRYV